MYAIGIAADGTWAHFVNRARAAGAEVHAVDLAAAVAGRWHLVLPPGEGESALIAAGERLVLDPSASYFCRLIDLGGALTDPEEAARWRGLVSGLSAWLERIPGTVINRPGARADNGAKPLHEHGLASLGLRVPESLSSSDGARLRAFAEAGPTVVKPLSGVRADARLVSAAEFDDFDGARGPVHLQRYVAGDDVRAHVIGERVCAVRIRSEAIDYRRDLAGASFLSHALPADVERILVDAGRTFGLTLAGWDFKLAPDGTLWCLEANPMPGYHSYDRPLEGAITRALLEALAGAPPAAEQRGATC